MHFPQDLMGHMRRVEFDVPGGYGGGPELHTAHRQSPAALRLPRLRRDQSIHRGRNVLEGAEARVAHCGPGASELRSASWGLPRLERKLWGQRSCCCSLYATCASSFPDVQNMDVVISCQFWKKPGYQDGFRLIESICKMLYLENLFGFRVSPSQFAFSQGFPSARERICILKCTYYGKCSLCIFQL